MKARQVFPLALLCAGVLVVSVGLFALTGLCIGLMIRTITWVLQ